MRNVTLTFFLVMALSQVFPTNGFAEEPLTQPLRNQLADISKQIDIVDQMVASVCGPDSELAQSHAEELVLTLKSQLVPQMDWEESVLYPSIDGLSGFLCYPFTASMRQEHVIMRRGLAELEGMQKDDNLEPLSFGRRADQLLGVIRSHFEIEEEVLFPLLDDWMSPHDFQLQILDKLPARSS